MTRVLQSHPSGDDIRPCYHQAVEIIERPDTLVSLTSNAAEKIRELMAEDPEGESSVLRVAIQGGGCSGFQYGLGFDAGPVEDDQTLEQHGVTIVIDPYSAPYLKGATIDFLTASRSPGSRSTTRTPPRRAAAATRSPSRKALKLRPTTPLTPPVAAAAVARTNALAV